MRRMLWGFLEQEHMTSNKEHVFFRMYEWLEIDRMGFDEEKIL